jgi:uncharacterized membrane protein YqjE
MSRSPNPASADGSLMGSVRRMTSALGRYAGARAQLFAQEVGQARQQAVRIAILGAVAGFCAILGYVALMAALTACMAHGWWDGRWAPALAITGAVHLVAAAGGAVAARRLWMSGGFFPATRREFKEDKKWLTTNESMR